MRRLVLHHHERLDGNGYPHGLAGDALELELRILTVCDVYDALVSSRVYRAAWSTEQALAHPQEHVGAVFDARCVEALVRVLGHGRRAEPAPLPLGGLAQA